MKKLNLLLGGCLLVLSVNAQRYAFSTGTKTYTEITNPDVLDTVLNNYVEFLPPHAFTVFGEKTDGTWNAGVSSGYLVASNTQYGFAMDPMMGTRLKKIPGISQLSVKTTLLSNDSVMTVQWKNMGLHGHASTDVLNFQAQVYLKSGVIEFHYGPSTITPMANDSAFMEPANKGPEVLLVMLTADFSNFVEFNAVSGNPASPVFSGNYARLNAVPAPNRVFTFTPKPKVGLFNQLLNSQQGVDVYPNPSTKGYCTIEAYQTNIASVKTFTLQGQMQSCHILSTPALAVDVNLPDTKQPYYLEITLVNGNKVYRKILVNE